MPVGGNTHGNWPVCGLLPDGRIPVISQLIPVVLKSLPEGIQFGPGFVTSRAWQAIFSGECRECPDSRHRGCLCYGTRDESNKEQRSDQNKKNGVLHREALTAHEIRHAAS